MRPEVASVDLSIGSVTNIEEVTYTKVVAKATFCCKVSSKTHRFAPIWVAPHAIRFPHCTNFLATSTSSCTRFTVNHLSWLDRPFLRWTRKSANILRFWETHRHHGAKVCIHFKHACIQKIFKNGQSILDMFRTICNDDVISHTLISISEKKGLQINQRKIIPVFNLNITAKVRWRRQLGVISYWLIQALRNLLPIWFCIIAWGENLNDPNRRNGMRQSNTQKEFLASILSRVNWKNTAWRCWCRQWWVRCHSNQPFGRPHTHNYTSVLQNQKYFASKIYFTTLVKLSFFVRKLIVYNVLAIWVSGN